MKESYLMWLEDKVAPIVGDGNGNGEDDNKLEVENENQQLHCTSLLPRRLCFQTFLSTN